MIKRSTLLFSLLTAVVVLGIIFKLTTSDSTLKKFEFSPPVWTKDYENKVVNLLTVYGVKKEWIKLGETQNGVIKKPEITVSTPSDLPIIDFVNQLNQQFSDQKFKFVGFDHRRDKVISLHAYDGQSTFAVVHLKISEKFKRNNQRIYLLIDNWTNDANDGSESILKKEIIATPMLVLKDVSQVQQLSAVLIKEKVDFGLRLLDQGSILSFHYNSPIKIKESNQSKIKTIFPSASFYLNGYDEPVKLLKKAGIKFINPSSLTNDVTLTSVSALNNQLSKTTPKTNYKILKVDYKLLDDKKLSDLITELQRKGFTFRYYRDFKNDLKNDG